MPGIVAAADRVAVWIEAAPPNSNKWKTPVNQLKNVLSAMAQNPEFDPGKPNAHPMLKEWADKYPGFVKTYLKPAYAGELKAALGDQMYGDFTKHMPKEHLTALTTHVQKPAPKSNKFISPANGLKSLLEGGTSNNKLWKWMEAHPQFTQSYLQNPEYADALKNHIGADHYNYWQKSFSGPKQPAQPKVDIQPDVHLPAPKPEQPKDDDQADIDQIKTHQETHGLAPEDDPWHTPPKKPAEPPEPADDAAHTPDPSYPSDEHEQAGYEHYMNTTGGNGPDWTTLTPEDKAKWNPPGHHHNQYTDKSQLEKNQVHPEQPKSAPTPEGGQDTDEIGKIQELLGPAHDLTKEETAQHSALVGGIKNIFPETKLPLESYSMGDLQGVLENWQKHLAHTPEHAENLKKIDALHKLFFGLGGVAPQPAPSPEPQPAPSEPSSQSFGEQLHEAYNWLGPQSWDGMLKNPNHAKQKLQQLINTWDFSGAPEGTKEKLQAVYDKQFGPDEDQDDIGAIKQHMDEPDIHDPDFQEWAKQKGWNGENAEVALPGLLKSYQKAKGEKSDYGDPDFAKLYHAEDGKYADTFGKDGFKDWWATLDDEHKKYYAGNPTGPQEAVIDYTIKHGDDDGEQVPSSGQDDQADIDAIKQHSSDALWDDIGGMLWGDHGDEEGPVKKQFQQWYDGLSPDEQALMAGKSVKPYNAFKKWQSQQPASPTGVDGKYNPASDKDDLIQQYADIFGISYDSAKSNSILSKGNLDDPDATKKTLQTIIKDWQGDPNEAKLQGLYDKYFGNATTGSQGTYTPDDLKAALQAEIFPPSPQTADAFKAWMAKSPEQVKHDLELLSQGKNTSGGSLGSSLLQEQWKTVYDKLYGDQSDLPPGFKEWAEEGGTPIEEYSPEELKAALSGFAETQALGKYAPAPTQSTGIKVGPHAPKDMLAPDGTLSQQAKEYLDASGWSYNHTGSWQPEDWNLVSNEGLGLHNGDNGKIFNDGWEAWKQQHPGGSSTPGGGSAPAPSGNSIPNVTPEELKKHLIDVAGWSDGAIGFDKLKGKNPEQVMKQLKVWADNGTGGPATKKLYDQLYGQVGPPKFDPQAFGKEYLSILPSSGSSLGSGGVSPQKAKQKLDQLINDYPGTEQTKKLQALKDKWFGGTPPAPNATDTWSHPQHGIQTFPPPEWVKKHWNVSWDADKIKKYITEDNPTNGGTLGQAWAKDSYGDKAQYDHPISLDQDDIDAISDEADNLPPPPPAKPFKSEKLNPVDLKKWAQSKPQSAVEWKQFANWWGDTKLTPQQEGKLYNTWFNKNATPEQAGKWFQQVFEQNSAPGEGDLGTEGTPGWAHNNWAFGHKADKEWPVFKEWAAKDPGFPKGTTLKQKVAIWNGLTDDEKAGITGDYMPEKPIDTGAVVNALKKAYPDSDWSNWSTLTQGKLESNLKNLGGSFGPAAKIYNQYFDGKLDIPKEDDKSTPKGPAQAPPEAKLTPIPVNEMGEWVGNYVGTPSTQGAAMAHYVRWAKSVGLDSEISKSGYYSPQAYKQYQGIPDEQKQAIKTMGTLPWHTKEEFKAWQDAQPSAKNELKKLFPEKAANGDFDNYTWDGNAYFNSQKSWLVQAVAKETDPAKKQALLGIYHQFYGVGQTTLAEHLKKYVGAPPPELKKQSWDQYLQSHTPDDVAKLIKKKLKNEPDPEKWVAYVDAFKKYIGGPSGHKWVTQMMGKGQGTPNNYALQKLFNWKKGNGTPQDDPYYSTEATSDFLTKNYPANTGKGGYLKYIGWAPPPGALSSFKGDPALYGDFSKKTYTAPEIKKGKQYQTLLKNSEGGDYSINDKKTMGSESFQHWFESAPQNYRDVMSDHPGIAIDDFAEFMKGGNAYSPVPEGGDGGQHWFDVAPVPFAKAKTPGAKDLPNFLTWNPPRPLGQSGGEHPKFPRHKDEQETIPLPAGQHWAPKYAPMPIYRVIRLNTQMDARDIPVPDWVKDKKLWQQQQAAKLSQIDEIINGKPTVRDPKSQEASFDHWAKGQNGIKGEALQQLKDDLFSTHPTLDLGTDSKWKVLDAFGTKYKNAVPATEIQNLAKELGIVPPVQGNYDHPQLAKLILDYMEGFKGPSPSSGDENANLGLHWTRDIDKAYHGVPTAGYGATVDSPTAQSIPVTISGYWDGRGEGSGAHGAYDPNAKSELEQNLRPNAPVFVKRLQIRSPDNDWHDLMDYGPISMWPPGRDETASGHRVWDKPSLANLLSKALPGQQFKSTEWDSLTPGAAADNKFAALMHQYAQPDVVAGKVQYDEQGHVKYKDPETAAKLSKIYRDFFVGRPDLPTKPHYRRASLERHLASNNPDDLTRLMAKWGTKNPERYGGTYYHRSLRPNPDLSSGPAYFYRADDPYSVGHETRSFGDHIMSIELPDNIVEDDPAQPRSPWASGNPEKWVRVSPENMQGRTLRNIEAAIDMLAAEDEDQEKWVAMPPKGHPNAKLPFDPPFLDNLRSEGLTGPHDVWLRSRHQGPWYHASPHKLSPGQVVSPAGGGSPYTANGFYNDAKANRRNWVWMADAKHAGGWMGTGMAADWANDHNPTNHLHTPMFIYEVQPHGDPQQWNAQAEQEGWVAPQATVTKLVGRGRPHKDWPIFDGNHAVSPQDMLAFTHYTREPLSPDAPFKATASVASIEAAIQMLEDIDA